MSPRAQPKTTPASTASKASKASKAPKAAKSAASLGDLIYEILDKNKGEEIIRLPLNGRSLMADEIIIASGTSGRHVAALGDYVMAGLSKQGYRYSQPEGRETGDWLLLDAGDVIVHIFRPETRSLYNLEKLWGEN